jgi:hypothetical protein
MKKIALLAAMLLTFVGTMTAQNAKAIAEKDVPSRNVIDFQRQSLDARSVTWYQFDSVTYEVRFIDGDDNLEAIRYSPSGTETRYYIDMKYCPQSIKDSISKNYSGFDVTDFCAKTARRNTTYEVRISKKSGFLFWRKEKEVKYLNFETTGEFIGE